MWKWQVKQTIVFSDKFLYDVKGLEVQVFEYFDKVIFTYTPASVKSTKNRPLMQIHALLVY